MPRKRNTTGATPAPGSSKATPGGVAEVEIGKRYSKRTALGDRHGPQSIGDESHHRLHPAKLKAWALEVLNAAGVDTGNLHVDHELQNEGRWLVERVESTVLKPIELAEVQDPEGRFLHYRMVAGGGFEHDNMPMLAARIYELARHVELSKLETEVRARAWYDAQAHAVGYELGRLSMLARVYGLDAETGARGGARATVDHAAVRRYHARLADQHDATSQTAVAFRISTRQVRNILKGSTKARPT